MIVMIDSSFIESNDDSEDREVVKDCLQDWL